MSTCAQCRAANGVGTRNCWNCGLTLVGVDVETLPETGAFAGQVQRDPMIGRWVLDQYVIRDKIGEGGMGAVYRAEQPSVGRDAAIKVVHPWLSRDPTIAARFGTEAKAAAKLQNPHIVSIYNYGKMDDGTLFLAMEYLGGYTLAELIRSQPRIDPARAVAIATQVCEALADAHRRGVVHRDLKPSNLMLVGRGDGPEFIKVLDFGVAKIGGHETTARGKVIGTPRYMAPEQLRGEPIDGRADIYALGLIVYEMLTGHPPFEADAPAALMNKHLNEMPRPLHLACPGLSVPPALEACVMRAVAKAAYQRPQNADVFADELWSALMATVELSSNVPIPVPRPKSTPPGIVAIAVGLVAVGVATAGYFGWKHVNPEVDADPENQTVTTSAPPNPLSPEKFDGFGPPSPEKQALTELSIPQLEAELERVTLISGLRRESINLSLAEYRREVENAPAGVDPTHYRKALLAELIIRWRAARSDTPPADRSVDELEAVFLTMNSPFDGPTRQRMLRELKKSTATHADPKTATKRKLMEWIATFGQTPEDAEVEIIDE